MVTKSNFQVLGTSVLSVIKLNKREKLIMLVKFGVRSVQKIKFYQHHAVKGATRIAAERFVKGTNFITKQ